MASQVTQGDLAAPSSNTRPEALLMDFNMATPESPSSELSDYPDNLSDCSEARRDRIGVEESLPAGTSKVEQFPRACPETPKSGHQPSSQDGLPTPPDTTRTSKTAVDQASIMSRARAAHPDMALASRSTAPRHNGINALPSIPRRSTRTRKSPAQYNPAPSTPKKDHSHVAKPRSLLAYLRIKPEILAKLEGNSPMASLSLYTAKRKQPDDTLLPDEPASQRPRLGSIASRTQTPRLFPYPPASHIQLPLAPYAGPYYAPPMLVGDGPLASAPDPFASSHKTQPPPYGFNGYQGPWGPQYQLVDQALRTPRSDLETFHELQPEHQSGIDGTLFETSLTDITARHVQGPSPFEAQPTSLNIDYAQYNLAPETTSSSVVDSTSGLYALAMALMAGSAGSTKPEPTSRPEVWATSRAELCESVHYFRAYKGASQTKDGVQRSFMFSKNAHTRDYTDASVVISRAGGGLEHDPRTGGMVQLSDQKCARNDAALKNSMMQLIPLIIITDELNPTMPCQVPHKYCVLDFFKATDIWAEKTDGKIMFRYRFEKFNCGRPSWWQPEGIPEVVPLGSLPPPPVQTCSMCNAESEQKFLQGWMCLRQDCSAFWKMTSESGVLKEPEEKNLVYDPRFLKKKTPWGNENHYYALTSDVAQISSYAVAGEDCSRGQWCGLVCPNCGRCCRRLEWTRWKCLNSDCSFVKEAPHTLIPAATLRDPFDPLQASYTNSLDSWTDSVACNIQFAFNYRIHRYTVPSINGYVTHLIANKTVVEEPDGPDDMFEELQRVDIGLERRNMDKDFYTRHFSVNYGMRYKFIAKTDTRDLEGAARPIIDSRSRLNWAAKLALAQYRGKSIEQVSESWKDEEFNEILALGYMEDQRINYHDDGESGLGPTIATLSLGAIGHMKIRMKSKHYNGVSKSGIITADPPLPGCQNYAERLAKQPMLEHLSVHDKDKYKVQARAVPKELKLSDKPTPPDVLTMTVRHGDIVIMHGADLQRYYEHSVDHKGKLRFALTCRYIRPDSLPPHERPEGGVAPDPGVYDGAKLPLPPTC